MTPDNKFNMDLPVYDEVTERSYVEAIGPTLTAAPVVTHGFKLNNNTLTQELWGYNFSNVTAVYLSATDVNSLSGETIDSFTSPDYPSFTGVSIDYNIINENKMTIQVPEGFPLEKETDVVLVNIAGYGTSKTSPLHGKDLTSS